MAVPQIYGFQGCGQEWERESRDGRVRGGAHKSCAAGTTCASDAVAKDGVCIALTPALLDVDLTHR